jgi:transposase
LGHAAAFGRDFAPRRDGCARVVLLDQAGWHTTDKLMEPANITMLPLPPKSPELNAQENIWQYLRQNFLSNRVFASYRPFSTPASTLGAALLPRPDASPPLALATGRAIMRQSL